MENKASNTSFYIHRLSRVHLPPAELKKNKSDCRFGCLLLSKNPCMLFFVCFSWIIRYLNIIHATVVWLRKYSKWNWCVYTCRLSLHTVTQTQQLYECGVVSIFCQILLVWATTFQHVSVYVSEGNIVQLITNELQITLLTNAIQFIIYGHSK